MLYVSRIRITYILVTLSLERPVHKMFARRHWTRRPKRWRGAKTLTHAQLWIYSWPCCAPVSLRVMQGSIPVLLPRQNRRRMESEGKAKVVASVWGAKFVQYLAALAVFPRSIWKKRLKFNRFFQKDISTVSSK